MKAFLLTSGVKNYQGSFEIHLWAQSQEGAALFRFNNEKHVFFVPRGSKLNSSEVLKKEVQLKNFEGKEVDAFYLENYQALNSVLDKCRANSIRTFEADVRPDERFLMERFINGQVEVNGKFEQKNGYKEFINPQIKPASFYPSLSTLSLDIETGVGGELYSVAMHMRVNNRDDQKIVFMLSHEIRDNQAELIYCQTEKQILDLFIKTLNEWNPDIITGWHVIGFDLDFLQKKALKNNLKLLIGRDGSEIRIEEGKRYAHVNGRLIIDGPPTLRAAFFSFKNFKLETVAQEVLNIGKDIASDSGKVDEIERRFREDKEALAKYNLLDCTLVLDIFDKLKTLDLLIRRVQISGLLIDRLAFSTAAFDHLFLPRLHRKGFVAPNVVDISRDEASSGGMVLAPKVGLHTNVAVFDFKSLYPSIIRTFKIDPYSLLCSNENLLETPVKINFSKSHNILADEIGRLLEERERAKRENNSPLSQAIKILMNSFYGVMGSSRCRFYHADLPVAITQTGHWILEQTVGFFENRNYEVLYGDTDSLFVKLPEENESLAKSLASEANEFIKNLIQNEFQVQSFLDLELEKIYDKIFFAQSRSSELGAKKKYAGLLDGNIQFVGMESVRSDWTELAKDFQKGLFTYIFNGDSVDVFIKETLKNLESGLYDDKLTITKRLSKDPLEYTKNKPPHVQAALLVNHTGPYRLKEVSYVMTHTGPRPIQIDPGKLDYIYYIEKQLRPVAEDILYLQGKSFDDFVSGAQLSMF